MYRNDLYCPLKCDDQDPKQDTQEHLLCCKKLANVNVINSSQIYGTMEEQCEISKLFISLIKKREDLLEESETSQPTKGIILGPGSRQQ